MNQHVYVDPVAARARLGTVIEQYKDNIERLRSDMPGFPPYAAGAGFTEQGVALADALRRMQELNISFLEHRVEGWGELIRLMDSIEQVDEANAVDVVPK